MYSLAAAQYPHYLAGAGPHDLQAAAAAGAYGSLHNNLPPSLNAYQRPPLVSDKYVYFPFFCFIKYSAETS